MKAPEVVKKTYSLPKHLVREFENNTKKRERSKIISMLVEEWIDHKEKERLRKQIMAGCREMSSLYLEIEKEYYPLEVEVEGLLNDDKKR